MNSLEQVEVVPSGAALGAEIRGIDFSNPIDEVIRTRLVELWHKHLVLLFRGQELTPDQCLATASIFGEPQRGGNRKYYEQAGRAIPHDLGIPTLWVLCNLDDEGNPTEVNDALGSQEVVWHTDNSYIDEPPAGSTLYSREIPDDNSGKTSFSNQYLAFEQLPADLKAAISDKSSKQDASRNSAGVLRPGVKKPETPHDVPGPMHPLVRRHPGTGRPALYLGRRRVWPSQYVEGLTNDESEALLDKLWAHANQGAFTWTHEWAIGDFLVWDNRCAMHRRDPVDATQRRVMWRTQFQGEPVVAA